MVRGLVCDLLCTSSATCIHEYRLLSLLATKLPFTLTHMDGNYFALVGDLIKSRKQPNRLALAKQIEDVLQKINRLFAKDLVAPLETTRGLDELSALLRTPDHAFDIVYSMNVLLWPSMFRFGLGSGGIDVWGDDGRASDMDGPAFHLAADALARGRHGDTPFAVNIHALSDTTQNLIEASGQLSQAVMRDWTPKTARAIRTYRPISGASPTQKQAAAQLGHSQQALSEAIRSGHLHELTVTRTAIQSALSSNAKASNAS